MTDIVERLRAVETDDIPQKYLMSDMLEAAAEIERLRATLDRIDRFITAVAPTKLTKELDSIRHEVRALKESRE
jgi:hypothetical protein